VISPPLTTCLVFYGSQGLEVQYSMQQSLSATRPELESLFGLTIRVQHFIYLKLIFNSMKLLDLNTIAIYINN
jgi:hypothetical protein